MAMSRSIRMNLGPYEGYLCPIFDAMKLVEKKLGFSLGVDPTIPVCSISVDGEIVAYIAHADGFEFNKFDWPNLQERDYKRVFKFHYSPNLFDYSIYGEYSKRIIPCGLYRWWRNRSFNKSDLLNRARPIDVVALMRYWNRGTPPNSNKPWAVARRTLIEQAKLLEEGGFNTRYGHKSPQSEYEKLLLDTKLGFVWSASAYLGWKIPEFIQQGIIMITEPLGKDYPFANDVIFEDNVHCVFCSDPKQFGSKAIELLEDPKRMNCIRKNIVDLWEMKLCPEKIGEWYYRKIVEH
jgi:hypothetical protein